MNKKEIKKRIKELKNYTQEVWTDNELLQHDRRILSLEKMLLQQENKQLKDNWNKLKKYIKSDGVSYLNFADERCFCNKKEAKYILNKMQELEKEKK